MREIKALQNGNHKGEMPCHLHASNGQRQCREASGVLRWPVRSQKRPLHRWLLRRTFVTNYYNGSRVDHILSQVAAYPLPEHPSEMQSAVAAILSWQRYDYTPMYGSSGH